MYQVRKVQNRSVPYDAIAKKERPCQKACGVNAIISDKYGRAFIDNDKMRVLRYVYGELSRLERFQTSLRSFSWQELFLRGEEIIAEIAPAFVGQFGPNITPRNIKAALGELGFSEVYEVALGADIGAIAEAHHYVDKVCDRRAFRSFSHPAVPSWAVMAKKVFSRM